MGDRPEIRDVAVTQVPAGTGTSASTDAIVVEEPLEFHIDGRPGAVTMRTPGQDEDLLRGFLFGEGLIAEASDIRSFDIPRGIPADVAEAQRGNVVDVRLRSPLARKRLPERSTFASSSCGVCGKVSIESLHVHAPVVQSELRASAAIVSSLPDKLRAGQAVFERTGGLHAAGAFSADGTLLAVREDIGRHNAVDKLVGWALAQGKLPASDWLLCVSGRLGFEIAQKAIVAGFPIVASVSAPSSLAVDLAAQHGVTVCGFVRDGRFNVYAHPRRIDV